MPRLNACDIPLSLRLRLKKYLFTQVADTFPHTLPKIPPTYRRDWREGQYARMRRYAQIRQWGKKGPRIRRKTTVSWKVVEKRQ